MSKLLHIKGSRTQVLKTLPTNDTGNDGDIVISVIQGRGIYLCIKANNRWYVSTKLEELRKIGKTTTKDLKADRVKIGNTTITKNEVAFTSCVGFTQLEPTWYLTSTVVDFRHSNKQFVTFGSGSITNLQLFFPLVSGNFVLLVKQDGTGSRTITNYKVYEFDESLADGSSGVVWAGGLAQGGPSGSSSGPNLTDDANHVDILSFYWDADNEIAYGVATLDFQF